MPNHSSFETNRRSNYLLINCPSAATKKHDASGKSFVYRYFFYLIDKYDEKNFFKISNLLSYASA